MHDTDTRESLPVNSKIYRMPDRVQECIKADVAKMLDLGVTEFAYSLGLSSCIGAQPRI